MQRVRVGMTGLAMVLILMGLASAIFTSANRDDPVSAVGAPKADVVANMTAESSGNTTAEQSDESLAELGVAPPSTAATESVDASAIARQLEAQRAAQREAGEAALRAEAESQAERER